MSKIELNQLKHDFQDVVLIDKYLGDKEEINSRYVEAVRYLHRPQRQKIPKEQNKLEDW